MSNKIVIAGSALIEKNGKFLLIKEGKNYCYGTWNLPGGRHEEDYENIISLMEREVKEETNLSVKNYKFLAVVQKINEMKKYVVKFVFYTTTFSGKIKIDGKEILDAQWFTLEEMKKLKLRDKDIVELVKRARQRKFYNLDLIMDFLR